jgi:hypothetical protein
VFDELQRFCHRSSDREIFGYGRFLPSTDSWPVNTCVKPQSLHLGGEMGEEQMRTEFKKDRPVSNVLGVAAFLGGHGHPSEKGGVDLEVRARSLPMLLSSH